MSLNYASLLHVLSPPIFLFNSSRLDRRLDNDLITSARRADVSPLARPTHACTCYGKFPGNQGRGQPVWSWAAATESTRYINFLVTCLYLLPPYQCQNQSLDFLHIKIRL